MIKNSKEQEEDEHWIVTLYQRYKELYGDPDESKS